MTDKTKRIIDILNLKPLTIEGGFYKETYRSNDTIVKLCLPSIY